MPNKGGSSSPPGAPQRGEGGLLDVKNMAAEPHLTSMSRAVNTNSLDQLILGGSAAPPDDVNYGVKSALF
jgi:hypothetical protein